MTDVVNLFEVVREEAEGEPPGYQVPSVRIGALIGAAALGMTVYELRQGQSICPYHYEYPGEEWLIVFEGTPFVRGPEGERALAPGDVVCFPAGPAGAHKVGNVAEATALVGMLSTKQRPAVAVYPDSDKIGIWAGEDAEVALILPRSAAVDYWHDET